MAEKMDDIEKEFVEYYQKLGSIHNLDNLFTKIFAILFIEPKAVPMEELAKKTGYSLASISNKLKMLESMNFITRKTSPGTRKVYVYLEKDFSKIMKENLKKHEAIIEISKKEIPKIIEKNKAKKLSNDAKKKLEIVENYYAQMLKFEKLVKKILSDIDKI